MVAVSNRKELAQFLERQLTKTYEDLGEKRQLEFEQNLLKTYIIESNLSSVSEIPRVEDYETSVSETKDKTLHVLTVKNQRGVGVFYVDTLNPRFWIFHTVSKSEFSDFYINKLVVSIMNGLDYPWLPIQFLEEIGAGEHLRGFSLRYEDEFTSADEHEGIVPVKTLSMKLWGNTASRVLEILRRDEELAYAVALSGIGIKHFANHDEYVIDDITFQGKFTARGTSIDAHFYVVRNVQRKYEEKLKLIEEHAISMLPTERGVEISGQPLTIVLKKPIENLTTFLDTLLSSKTPFRLWGLSKFMDKDFVRVNAVDLHTSHELNLEVTPNWIRIYLPEGSCGNTVLRLFTNIQHYYDSNAELEGAEDERII